MTIAPRKISRWLLCSWVLGATLALPQAAAARMRVVILSLARCCPEEYLGEAESKTRAEISALGLEVVVVTPEKREELLGNGREKLGEAAEASEADCAVMLGRPYGKDHGEFDIWVRASESAKARFWHAAPRAEGLGNPASLLSLRVAEAVRAGLPRTEEDPFPAPQGKRQRPGVRLGAGAGFLWSPGGAASRTGLELSIGFDAAPGFVFEVQKMYSPWGRGFGSGTGRVYLELSAIRGFAFWDVLATPRLRPALGFGAGALLSWTEKQPTVSAGAIAARAAAAYLGPSLRLTWQVVSRRLWVQPELRLGWAIPKLRLLVGEEELATLGAPLVEAALQVGLQL